MKTEVKIILDSKIKSLKGSVFEEIIRDVLQQLRYEVKSNINFTGMELDLVAKHLDNDEEAYVECKAKEKVASNEIHTFVSKKQFKNVDKGYFISTVEYEHDVGGLVDEMSKDNRYKDFKFWDPQKIIELLIAAKRIDQLDLSRLKKTVTKKILAATYFGKFYVLILSDSLGIPGSFSVYSASDCQFVDDRKIIDKLQETIPEIKDLNEEKASKLSSHPSIKQGKEVETIAEVQESEHWYDYLPASSKNFFGRDELKKSLFDFFEQVRSEKTARRAFYLDGKSGWGKSSLVAEIRSEVRKGDNKGKFFVFAADTRSALSNNFVALAFSKMLERAAKAKFIDKSTAKNIEITSALDVLSSDSVKKLMEYLKAEGKVLILIFDQFEDIFRNTDLFRSFYKLLIDADGMKSNLIVGFSWKSEINISIENESYSHWQNARDCATEYNVPPFGSREIDKVISQLEAEIGEKLDITVKSRLKEASQGFPWLVKKLCIHTFNQIKLGKTIADLLDEELNFEALFKKDLESLTPREVEALRYMAKRAYEGKPLDSSEIDENIEEAIINQLVHKRLIIKSGTKYNIYWDIFRDYLVTDTVPEIGESYILRQSVNTCLKIFLQLETQMSAEEIAEKIQIRKKAKPTIKTIWNILADLRSIGLVKRIEGTDFFTAKSGSVEVTEEAFKKYLNKKFSKYSPYLKLTKSTNKQITQDDVVLSLKETFKGSDFSEQTWNTYANNLVGWFRAADLPLNSRLYIPEKGKGSRRKNLDKAFLYTYPPSFKQTLLDIAEGKKLDSKNYTQKSYLSDLSVFLLIDNSIDQNLTDAGNDLIKAMADGTFDKKLSELVLKLPKVKMAHQELVKNKPKSANALFKIAPYLIEGSNAASKKMKMKKIYPLLSWARYIEKHHSK